jgi:hypothetical protein
MAIPRIAATGMNAVAPEVLGTAVGILNTVQQLSAFSAAPSAPPRSTHEAACPTRPPSLPGLGHLIGMVNLPAVLRRPLVLGSGESDGAAYGWL